MMRAAALICLMAGLWAKTPEARRGRYAATSDELRETLLSDLRAT